MTNLTPAKIYDYLDRYVISQSEAKKAVAVALRNRWRRGQVQDDILRNEISPRNILMIGPTGVGKTEIARRLARLTDSPFIKVEATKYTEVGYVGRDVESMIRDLLEIAINQEKERQRDLFREQVRTDAEDRILDALVGADARDETKDIMRKQLQQGELDEREIDISIAETPSDPVQTMEMMGGQLGILNISEVLGKALSGKRSKTVRMKVEEARLQIINEEVDKLMDQDSIVRRSIQRVEQHGIIFIDEIDKLVSNNQYGGDGGKATVSKEGVQRDLLPVVEGTTINTKYGPISTHHILFIGSGSFHFVKPSDLLPELQGRFPVRVYLEPLTAEDMFAILSKTEYSLPKQYSALMQSEGLELNFTSECLLEIANVAEEMNQKLENIGARRLQTIFEKLLQNLSFNADTLEAGSKITIDVEYLKKQLADVLKDKSAMDHFIL